MIDWLPPPAATYAAGRRHGEDAHRMQVITREPAGSKARFALRRGVVVLLCLLMAAAIGWAIWFWPARSGRPDARNHTRDQPIPVLVERSTTADVPIYLDGLGTVQAFNTVTVRSMVDGPLIEVRFKEGQDVHAGDVLARIDPRTFQAALDQAVAKKAQDQANLANAKLDLARYQKLAATAYTSAQQADTQKATVAQLEAQVQQDQAQIDNARTQLQLHHDHRADRRPHRAAAGGCRQHRPCLGRDRHRDDHHVAADLGACSPCRSRRCHRSRQPCRRARRRCWRWSKGGGRTMLDRGTLTVLDNQVDPTTGTIKLKATFPNPGHKLWPGGFVGVRLKVETARNAVVVPPAAVQRGPRGPYVYVVKRGQHGRAPDGERRARGRAGLDHHRGRDSRARPSWWTAPPG